MTDGNGMDSPARFAAVALVTCCAVKAAILAGVLGVSLGAVATNPGAIAAAMALVAVAVTAVVRRRLRARRSCAADRVAEVAPVTRHDVTVGASSTRG